jgi:dihydrofolate reductase
VSTRRKANDQPLAVKEWGWRYHHIGVPTNEPIKGEKYLSRFKLYVSGFDTSPYGIEWMRFEPGSPIDELIKTVPHIAFEVDDLDRELSRHDFQIITPCNAPGEGIRIAMISHNGAPIELIEFSKEKYRKRRLSKKNKKNKTKMRKVKLQMQMTINGYVGGLKGEGDWMTWNPDPEFIEFLASLIDTSDTLLLGRKTAEGIINYWENEAVKNPGHPFAKKITDIPKVVFTKTLDKSIWNTTTLAKGNLTEEIAGLKKQNGKDILIFGGADFVSSLIKEGLIDEYHLIINPTAMGNGMTIFNSLDSIRKFTPIQSKLFSGGKTVLSFRPKND